jgi:tRNA dimethylallyltransferase
VQRLAIVGSTASGKSALAESVFERFAGRGIAPELVSVDSMCVYRGMDIGTAKASTEEQARWPHHLINVVDPSEEYSVSEFQKDALRAIGEIEQRSGSAIAVGGTGLYVDALVNELTIPGQFPEVRAELESEEDTELLYARLLQADPMAASRMEPNNRRRIVRALEVTVGSGRPFSSFGPGLVASKEAPNKWLIAGVRWPRPMLGDRIPQRFETQMQDGFLEEAASVLETYGESISRTAQQALGYRELWEHLRGSTSLDEAIESAILRTRQFAVRQERWFRRDPRIHWIDMDSVTLHEAATDLVNTLVGP